MTKEESKYRPWTFEETPSKVIFKSKHINDRMKFAFCSVSSCGYNFTGSNFSFEEMLKDFLYSSDNGKTWLPCGTLI